MRSKTRFAISAVLSVLILLAATSAAQQIRYPDFSSTANLKMNGSAHAATWQNAAVLRLTDGPQSPIATNPQQSSAYFQFAQPLTSGFTTWFQFQMHNPARCCTPGDGIAFIIQNSDGTDSSYGARGAGLTAVGATNGGMGYAGIDNNLAIEFDIQGNPWDPNSNHVSVQSCGPQTNTPVHLPGVYTIGNNHNVTSCLLSDGAINTSVPNLGDNCSGGHCQDGVPHDVVIEYTPPGPGQQQGLLQVWLDPQFILGTHTPVRGAPTVISVPYNIAFSNSNPTGLNLDLNGGAWVGFTGSQPIMSTAQDIRGWEFTPHSPLMITQTIPPGRVENDFVFGGYQLAVTYPTGFTNPDGIQMTVLATPVNRNIFYVQRLLGTQFANETCVQNLETGGNCVVYSVTCSLNGQQITCPSETDPTIAICTQFFTSDPITITNADYLEADPIGSNNWISIFTDFTPQQIDPIVSGKGTGFSDLVATFRRNGAAKVSAPANATPPMRSPGSGGGICPPVQ